LEVFRDNTPTPVDNGPPTPNHFTVLAISNNTLTGTLPADLANMEMFLPGSEQRCEGAGAGQRSAECTVMAGAG
jgi:hypothetical protein